MNRFATAGPLALYAMLTSALAAAEPTTPSPPAGSAQPPATVDSAATTTPAATAPTGEASTPPNAETPSAEERVALPAATAEPAPVPALAPPEQPATATANETGSQIDAAGGFDELEAALDTEAPGPSQATSAPASAPSPGARGTGSIQPDISAIMDVAGAYFSQKDPLQAGDHDPNHTGFNFQQLELSLASTVDPYLRFDSHLVFSPDGVEVEEAYATSLALPFGLQTRFGQFLTRFGRLNPTHPHTWNFADQPFELSRVFGGEGERGIGLEVSELLPLPFSVELVGSVTEAAGEGTTRSFLGADDRPIQSLGDLLYTTALKQFFALGDAWSLAAGVSANFGPNSSGPHERTEIYGADAYLKYRPIHEAEPPVVALHSEWFYRKRHLPEGSLQDYGQFSELMWRFALRWAAAVRYELGTPSYDAAGDVAPDPLDPDWLRARDRTSASLSFYPTEFSRFRLQGSRDVPRYRNPIWASFLTAEVVIGAHGAHQF